MWFGGDGGGEVKLAGTCVHDGNRDVASYQATGCGTPADMGHPQIWLAPMPAYEGGTLWEWIQPPEPARSLETFKTGDMLCNKCVEHAG